MWVSESTPRGLYSRLHERFMIHMTVCLRECVLENLCVFPNAQALTGKREQGETEGKEKRMGDGGY